MWDDILEVVAEVVLDCAVEASGKKKPIRILLAALAWVAAAALLLWIGIAEKDASLTVLGVAVLIALAVWLYFKISGYNQKRK